MNALDSSKKVLITGAQGALGSHVAAKFLEAGHEVTGTYFPQFIKSASSPSLQWVELDITDSKQVQNALSQKAFDILIHCAGGFRFSPVDQITDQDLDFLLNTNLRSSFLLARALLPGMKQRNFGRMVFVSSKATLNPGAGVAAYAASKAGLNMLTASLAEEVKKFNITVNSVLPSVIDTPANRKDMPGASFSDWVKPEQLADIIYSLTTSLGNPIHGALLPVAGRV